MQKKSLLASAAALALLLTSSMVSAQVSGSFAGASSGDDRIDTIQEDVADVMAQSDDEERFGSNQYAQGWTGSVAFNFSGTSGSTDTADVSVGGRLRYGNGPWNHTVGFALDYGWDNGAKNEQSVFASYDVNRYLTDQFYLFGLASVDHDKFSNQRVDSFLGFGPGYRIVNTPDMTWRVQAGPGVRYIDTKKSGRTSEASAKISSRFYYKLSDTLFLTNDTDVLHSNTSTTATNDFGINVKMTDALSTRVGYRAEFTRSGGSWTDTNNALSVAAVYGF